MWKTQMLKRRNFTEKNKGEWLLSYLIAPLTYSLLFSGDVGDSNSLVQMYCPIWREARTTSSLGDIVCLSL